jgi:hypothetical protein
MAEFNLGTLSSTPTVSSNFVGSSDYSDLYSFNLSTTSNINLALTGLSADADVTLYRDVNNNGVIDSSDTQISYSNSSGSHDEAINVANQSAGQYLVQVYQYSGDTKYDLRLSATTGDPISNLLPTETEVGTLSSTRTFYDSVGSTDTADVYHFSVNSSGTFRLSLTGLSNDADVRLIRDTNSDLDVDPNVTYPNGEVVAVSRNGGTSSESITASLTAGDNYFVQVYQYNGDTSYNLTISYA